MSGQSKPHLLLAIPGWLRSALLAPVLLWAVSITRMSRKTWRMSWPTWASVNGPASIPACVGFFRGAAQAVVRRRKEIGIRMVPAARRPHVLRVAMKEAAAMVLGGSVLEIAGAVALVRMFLWASPSFETISPAVIEPTEVLGPPLLSIAVHCEMSNDLTWRMGRRLDPCVRRLHSCERFFYPCGPRIVRQSAGVSGPT
jgi:hypothetical protein